MADKDETPAAEEPLSPAARLFQTPASTVYIIVKIGSKIKINPSIIKAGFHESLTKFPRWSSKMVGDVHKGGKAKWVRTRVNVDDHVIVPDLDPEMDLPERFIEDYISHVTQTPMDMTKPLWEFHILNVKTTEAEAIGIFRIHHSVGDGVSLMSLVLACTKKSSDPQALPSLPVKKQVDSERKLGFWWIFITLWSLFTLMWNTTVDVTIFLATLMYLRDTKTPIYSGRGVENVTRTRRFVHTTINLDDIKFVKNSLNMTINDVLLGITQAGLSRYLNRKYGEVTNSKDAKDNHVNLPKGLRVRGLVYFNLRPTPKLEVLSDRMTHTSRVKWGNLIGYVILPFVISPQNDPINYVHQAKALMDRKKQSLESIFTAHCASIVLKIFGSKVASRMLPRMTGNTTLVFSNMVGPMEEISFYGHPITYFAPGAYGCTNALVLHFQSYANKMTIVATIDPDVIPDPHQLCDDFKQSLLAIKDAIVLKENSL